ncbi:MAG: hypothetical protein QOD56_1580 [Gammaproteobacteria bacterium]|jgi:hypothetical protein|nr:hypothetical protein [Mycobacterium sp.]MEA3150641.1 hypothetical protein [Gammaproteobacteria bacterium]
MKGPAVGIQSALLNRCPVTSRPLGVAPGIFNPPRLQQIGRLHTDTVSTLAGSFAEEGQLPLAILEHGQQVVKSIAHLHSRLHNAQANLF